MSQLEDYPAPAYDVERAQLNWYSGRCALTKASTQQEEDDWFEMCDILRQADPEQRDWEVVQFDHWSCEYVLEVFMRPGSRASAALLDLVLEP